MVAGQGVRVEMSNQRSSVEQERLEGPSSYLRLSRWTLIGDIQTFPLSAVGRLLHEERKTGILTVSSGDHSTKIYFRNGDIVFISGQLAEELSLGSLLKDKNLVSEAQIEASLSIARQENKRLGVVLMETGYVSQEKVVQLLNYQFKEAVSKVLTWRKGDFVYKDGLDGFVEDIRLKLDPIRLVAEAEKWKAYRSLIPSDQVVFEIREGVLKSSSFSTDGALRVMLLIDGHRDVSKIITETGLPRLGVYRALAALSEQGAIVARNRDQAAEAAGGLSSTTLIQYFVQMIQDIAADISLELGEKNANRMLTRSLKHSSAYERFLDEVDPEKDWSKNVQQVSERLKKDGSRVSQQELEAGFRSAVFNILQEEHQILGRKAAHATLGQLIEANEKLHDTQKPFVKRMLRFLNTLRQDESYMTGQKSFADSNDSEIGSQMDHEAPLLKSLDKIGGAAIIAFYSRIMQLVLYDLEADIGTKADALVDKILERSDYYDKFLSQYRVRDDVQNNVTRIRDHISKSGFKLGKNSFISGFQQALADLLAEKKTLLGEKSTRSTIFRIEDFMSNIAQPEYKPLTMHLIMTLKRVI